MYWPSNLNGIAEYLENLNLDKTVCVRIRQLDERPCVIILCVFICISVTMFQFAKMMVVLVSFSVASLPLDTTKDLMFQYCWYRTCIDLISHVSRRFPTAFSLYPCDSRTNLYFWGKPWISGQPVYFSLDLWLNLFSLVALNVRFTRPDATQDPVHL